jgi:hypothetical protein
VKVEFSESVLPNGDLKIIARLGDLIIEKVVTHHKAQYANFDLIGHVKLSMERSLRLKLSAGTP